MLADIFVTSKGRPELLRRSLDSLRDCTPRDQFRLTVVLDGNEGGQDGTLAIVRNRLQLCDHVLVHKENMGLGPSINQALAHIDALKRWDTEQVPLTVYLQDDVLYTPGWLQKLSQNFLQLMVPLKLQFATGVECPEHPWKNKISSVLGTKDWIRATCMMALHQTWMSMWPISRIDPETGKERGRPHDGLGSSVDWWFIRNHPNSVCRSGRTNLVMPGLLQHAGYRDSTWLKRELPESATDKERIG